LDKAHKVLVATYIPLLPQLITVIRITAFITCDTPPRPAAVKTNVKGDTVTLELFDSRSGMFQGRIMPITKTREYNLNQ
jgi:hypothetical protein